MYPKTGQQKGGHYHNTIRKWRWCNFPATWVQGIKIAKRPLNLVLSFPHTFHFPHPFYLPSSSSSHTYLKTDPSFSGKPSPSPALAPWSSLPWSDPSTWPSRSYKACHRPVTSLTLCEAYLLAILPGGTTDVEEQAIFIFTAVAHHIVDPQTFVELVTHAFESKSVRRSIFWP